MDMLSGVLTGSGFGPGVHGPYQAEHRSGAGQLMIVLDISVFQPIAEFNRRMDEMVAGLKSVPLAQGFDEIFYPGEIEARHDIRNRRDGLLLPDDTLADLRRLAEQVGSPNSCHSTEASLQGPSAPSAMSRHPSPAALTPIEMISRNTR